MTDYTTLTQISRVTKIPESTLRRYRDRFNKFFETTGQGRNRLYKNDAVAIFLSVKKAFDRGLTAELIERDLENTYTEHVTEQEVTEAVELNTPHPALQGLMKILKDIAENQKKLVAHMEDSKKQAEQLKALQQESDTLKQTLGTIKEETTQTVEQKASEFQKKLSEVQEETSKKVQETRSHFNKQLIIMSTTYLVLFLIFVLIVFRDQFGNFFTILK